MAHLLIIFLLELKGDRAAQLVLSLHGPLGTFAQMGELPQHRASNLSLGLHLSKGFGLREDGLEIAKLVGLPQAVDLNLISAPPDNLNIPPYDKSLRDDVAPGAHWIERLVIR